MVVRSESQEPAATALRCCPPLWGEQLALEQAQNLARCFRVLGDASRLQILNLITLQPEQQVCACELVETLGLSQPTVSHHLKVLHGAGFLSRDRRGTLIYYQVIPSMLDLLCRVLRSQPPSDRS